MMASHPHGTPALGIANGLQIAHSEGSASAQRAKTATAMLPRCSD